jgi:hypothetical protein
VGCGDLRSNRQAALSEAAARDVAAVRVAAVAGPGAETAAAREDAEGATALTTDCYHLVLHGCI